jgi:hypothetical protein
MRLIFERLIVITFKRTILSRCLNTIKIEIDKI